MNNLATIDWKMTVVDSGKSLRIEYKVTSHVERRLYLADLLPVPGPKLWALGKKAIIVMNDSEPDTVAFVRGRVASAAPLLVLLDPGARSLEPGQTQFGVAEVPLPLQAMHYRGTVAPLRAKPAYAVLEIGYLEADAHWTELLLDDGSKLILSSPTDKMLTLRSDRKPLPSP